MAFGPNSTNPRERRAYAHTMLAQLKQGEVRYGEALEAVDAASQTRKGKESGLAQSLGNTAVVLVDWGATSFERPGIIHHNFGGFLMSKAEAERWTAMGSRIRELVDRRSSYDPDYPQDPELQALHQAHNKRYDMGYEAIEFTRIFKGELSVNDRYFPELGEVINPAEIEDIMPFTGWNNTAAVDARVAQLQ